MKTFFSAFRSWKPKGQREYKYTAESFFQACASLIHTLEERRNSFQEGDARRVGFDEAVAMVKNLPAGDEQAFMFTLQNEMWGVCDVRNKANLPNNGRRRGSGHPSRRHA